MRNYLYFLTLILEKTPLGMKWYYFPYNEEYIYSGPKKHTNYIFLIHFSNFMFWFICFPWIWFMFQTKNEVKSHSVCFSLLKKCCYPILSINVYTCIIFCTLSFSSSMLFTKIYKIIKCTLEFVAHSSTTSFIWSRFVCISLYRSLAFKTIFNKSTFAFSITVFGYENNIEIENVHHVLP